MIQLYSVEESVKYSRRPTKRIHLKVTAESNFIVIWVGRCQDTKPWEESDWIWTIEETFKIGDLGDAIERCVIRSIEFAKTEAK